LIALGENARASQRAAALRADASDPSIRARARLYAAYASAFARESAASAELRAIAADAAYEPDRPVVLFLLHRFYADAAARARLASEFPLSPENRALSGDGVSLAALPHWLFSADRESIVLRPERVDAPSAAAAPDSKSAGPIALQVGLYRDEKNARALVSRLAAKGFAATATGRKTADATYWAVTVAPGEDHSATLMRLKDAGFESFPLF